MRLFSRAGYSLFELTIALAIGSTLLASAVPALKRILEEAELRTEARILAETIEGLSLTAQLRGERIILRIEEGGFAGHRRNSAITPFITRSFQNQVYASETGELTLSSTGVVSPASIVLSRNNRRCLLTVALRGRVQVLC